MDTKKRANPLGRVVIGIIGWVSYALVTRFFDLREPTIEWWRYLLYSAIVIGSFLCIVELQISLEKVLSRYHKVLLFIISALALFTSVVYFGRVIFGGKGPFIGSYILLVIVALIPWRRKKRW